MTEPKPKPIGICPFCAEEIKLAASLCKHCRSDLSSIPKEVLCQKHKFHLGKCIYCGAASTET